MRCGFCGHEFEPTSAESACAGCPLVKGCRLVRCPRCGYEMPPQAWLVRELRELRRRVKDQSSSAPTRSGRNLGKVQDFAKTDDEGVSADEAERERTGTA